MGWLKSNFNRKIPALDGFIGVCVCVCVVWSMTWLPCPSEIVTVALIGISPYMQFNVPTMLASVSCYDRCLWTIIYLAGRYAQSSTVLYNTCTIRPVLLRNDYGGTLTDSKGASMPTLERVW